MENTKKEITVNNQVWVPACGGTEEWTTARNGRKYLYVWWQNAPENTPANLRHGWLGEDDIIREDDPYMTGLVCGF